MRKIRAIMALFVAASLTLAGCGDGGEETVIVAEDDTSEASLEATAPESTDQESEDETNEPTSDDEATEEESEEEDKAALTADELEELIALLTVSTVSEGADCPSTGQFGVIGLRVGALEDIPPRLESDFMSTPVQATEPEPARDEIQGAVCEDPLLGVSYLVFFATDVRDELLDKTGIDVLELNEWMKPFAVDPSEINSLAAEYIPLLDVEDPSEEQVLNALAKNREWQKLASYANTLLDRFKVEGIEARPSVVNYHLAIGGLVVGGLPEVERNPNQEDMPALVLSLTEKDQCVPLVEIGINVGDKRPELFEPPVCEPPPPPPPPPSTTTPSTTVPPSTTTPSTTAPPTTTTTVPPTTTTTTTTTTSTTQPPTTTTTVPCGDKVWNPVTRKCEPPPTTVPPPPTTPPPASPTTVVTTPPTVTTPTTVQPPASSPSTSAPPTTRVEY